MYNESDMEEICFGWDRPTDERSLRAFLKKFSKDDFLEVLIPRLTDKELTTIIDQLTLVMKAHLSEHEYHHLFLTQINRGENQDHG